MRFFSPLLTFALLFSSPVEAMAVPNGLAKLAARPMALLPSRKPWQAVPSPSWLGLLRGGEVSELATGAYEWCVNCKSSPSLRLGLALAKRGENVVTPQVLTLYTTCTSVCSL